MRGLSCSKSPLVSCRRLAAFEIDDEDVLPPVADPADAVELVEDAREAARRALALVLLVVRLVAYARVKAMRDESGDQTIDSTLSFRSVSLRASPPSAGMT